MKPGIPLTEPILEATNPASFARRKEVFVYLAGTSEEAQAYIDAALTAPVPQPLLTDDGGRVEHEGLAVYFASGEYELEVEGQRLPWKPSPVDLTGYQTTSEKGAANGYASLEAAGKVPVAQLPSAVMEYQGTWNASTNTPKLEDGKGSAGDVYRVSVAGERNLGSGSISFEVGDYAVYNGSAWEKSDTTDAVASVAGKKGAVTLGTADIEGLGAALEGKQPLDSDLSAIAALSTSLFGRSVLTLADAAAARTAFESQKVLGYTAEDSANKDSTGTLGTSNTKYPTQGAVKTYADAILGQIPVVANVKSYGAKGDGTTDDTSAIKSAITAALASNIPVYIPPGEFKVTGELKLNSDKVAFFGTGPASKIVPEKSSYDCLVIGPGAEGSGSRVSGYARDFQITGGNAEVAKTGVASVTGKAAFKLDGMRQFEVKNVTVDGAHDIGFALVHNCFGAAFYNCRTGLEAVRVGCYLPKNTENGEDIDFNECWFSGEVAALHITNGRNYRYRGGQLTSNRKTAVEEDLRGVVILGKDYLGAEGAGEVDLTLETSHEFSQRCWVIRAFKPVNIYCHSSIDAGNDAANPALGFYKSSEHLNSVIQLQGCRWGSSYFSKPASEIVVREGATSDSWWEETGSRGTYTDGTGETNALWNNIARRAEIPRSTGLRDGNIFYFPGGEFKVNSGILEFSNLHKETWKKLFSTGGDLYSPNTLTAEAELAHKGTKAGFFGSAPVTKPTALTAATAETIDLTYGEQEKKTIENLRTRVNELETKLKSLGLLS